MPSPQSSRIRVSTDEAAPKGDMGLRFGVFFDLVKAPPLSMAREGMDSRLRRPLRNSLGTARHGLKATQSKLAHGPLYVRDDGGADRPPLGEETVIQLGRPANLILEPEQLPGQVQARIGKAGPRRNDMSAAHEVFVGIDVSKEWFDVAVRPGQECWRGSQDEAGVATFTDRLQQLRPAS